MAGIDQYLSEKDAFIFELDNVIYPEKDYLLQVYYLFAQFIEYGEQINAAEILSFMESHFIKDGKEGIYHHTAKHFGIPDQYQVNFDLLLNNARLPLKLLMYAEVLKFMQTIVVERKQLFIFTDGNPLMQLNKIKQLEWQGLEQYLRVFFSHESEPKPSPVGIQEIMTSHELKSDQVLMIGATLTDEKCSDNAMIDFLNVEKLLLT